MQTEDPLEGQDGLETDSVLLDAVSNRDDDQSIQEMDLPDQGVGTNLPETAGDIQEEGTSSQNPLSKAEEDDYLTAIDTALDNYEI